MQEALGLIQKSNSIVFATHVNPDADTLGSALGLLHSLSLQGKNSTVYNATQLPKNLSFLYGYELVSDIFPSDADLVIAFDCGNKDRLSLKDGAYKIINIDHHASNPLYGDIDIVDPTAASTASVVLELLRDLKIEPTKEAAVCLYTALVSDTGFFAYDNVDKRAFIDAAYLAERGVNPSEIATLMTQNEPLSKIKLHSKILSTLTLMGGGKMAFVYMSDAMAQETGAMNDEADGAAESARSVSGVEVSLFLREQRDGTIRGSLRSKSDINVNKLASLYGGGGHIKAAGFTVAIKHDFLSDVQEIAKTIENNIG